MPGRVIGHTVIIVNHFVHRRPCIALHVKYASVDMIIIVHGQANVLDMEILSILRSLWCHWHG
jgi:hypothetical protein